MCLQHFSELVNCSTELEQPLLRFSHLYIKCLFFRICSVFYHLMDLFFSQLGPWSRSFLLLLWRREKLWLKPGSHQQKLSSLSFMDELLIGVSSTGNVTLHSISKPDEELYRCNVPGVGESQQSWLSVTVSALLPYKLCLHLFLL